jgi:hypothetical protein
VVLAIITRGTEVDGDKVRIILCDTLAAELTFPASSGTCISLSLFQDGDFIKNIAEYIPTDTVYFWAGYSATAEVLWATISSGALPNNVKLQADVGVVSGLKVGVGTGSQVDGTIKFTEFKYFKHNYDPTLETCYGPGLVPPAPVDCNFVRPWITDVGTDVTELGCEWEIESGTWDIEGVGYPFYNDRVACTGDANALIESKIDQSEFNCSEYTDFGYHSFSMYIHFDTVGDTARIYVDWDGWTGHYVEIEAGGMVGDVMSLGYTKLYKGGDQLEDPPGQALLFNVPMDWEPITIETAKTTDGSELVIVAANGRVAWTTVYGHKRVAFGTGDTVNGIVKFMNGGLSPTGGNPEYVESFVRANVNDCATWYTKECTACPGGNAPDGGMIFDISGVGQKYGSYCDCDLLNGQWVATDTGNAPPEFGGGCGGKIDDTYVYGGWLICYFSGFLGYPEPVIFNLTYNITARDDAQPGWMMVVMLDINSYYAGSVSSPKVCSAVVYHAYFEMTDLCDDINNAVFEFSHYHDGGYYPDRECCYNLSILTIIGNSF